MKRRRLLQLVTGSTGVGLAGCADLLGGEDDHPVADDNSSESESADSGEATEPTDDSTPENNPPTIVDLEAEPTDYGTSLLVTLEGEGGTGIKHAEISYGDLGIEETPSETSVTVEGELTDIHEAELEETPGTVVFTLEDVEGEVTKEEEQPHFGSPSVSVRTAATASPGELQIEIEAEDDIGLHWIEVELNGESIEEFEIVGTDEAELNVTLDDATSVGDTNDMSVTARNTFGNTQSRSQKQYSREFEPTEEQDIDVGAVYMPFFEHDSQWDDCAIGTPEVGTYYMDDEKALNRHGDLMRGHGISRVQFDFFEPSQTDPFLDTRSNTLLTEIPLEAMYVISNSMNWRGEKTIREQLDDCLRTIRESFFSAPNYAERDGRPTVTFHDISWVTWGGNELSQETKDYILDEWDGFEQFGGYLRSELTVDGVEPYMIGGFGSLGETHYRGEEWIFDEQVPLARAFDAVSNWTGPNPADKEVLHSEHFDFQERNFEGYNGLAEREDIEYIPVVNPGFDDRDNSCWGADRFMARDADHFAALFNLAKKYRTVDRTDVASFNDWGEGHMIESGTYQEEQYGTEYLEVVKKSAQGDD